MDKIEPDAGNGSQMERLVRIIDTLRGDRGCPWDREQTPRSMTVYLIEELHELVDAIMEEDPAKVCEELGDLLFHILFLESIFRGRGDFDLEDVARISADKMVRRHPHVFGDKEAKTVEDVKNRWHRIKQREKAAAGEKKSLMDSVPRGLPTLVRAYRITERASRVGFDWPDTAGVMAKIKEEFSELEAAMAENDKAHVAEEMGDLLFSFVNLARFLRVHPETALADTVKKFEKRFIYIEDHLAMQNRRMEDATLEEMDALWNKAKSL